MLPAANDSRSGHVDGLSIEMKDGTSVPLRETVAEGRRQQAREIRRLAVAAARRIARTARIFVSMVPAHESKRKIPVAMSMARRLAIGTAAASFRTDAVIGHIAGAYVEGAASNRRTGNGRHLAA